MFLSINCFGESDKIITKIREVFLGVQSKVFSLLNLHVNLNSHIWLLMSLFGIILINDAILTTCFIVEGRKVDRGREMEREGGEERQ